MTTDKPELPSSEPRAVIWDVDGTLIDSVALHFSSWHQILQDENYALTHDGFMASFGQRNDAVLRGFLGDDLGDDDIDRIATVKEERYRELVRREGIQALPGVRRW